MATEQSGGAQPLHAFVITYPVQGHVTPGLHLSRLLLDNGLDSITFLTTRDIISRHSDSRNPAPALHPRLQFLEINPADGGGFPSDANTYQFLQSTYALQPAFEKAAEETLLSPRYAGHRHLVISDTFCSWTSSVAQKFNLPWVAFWTSSFSVFLILHSLPTLVERGYVPTQGGMVKKLTESVDCLPYLPQMRVSDLPAVLRVGQTSAVSRVVAFMEDQVKALKYAHSLLGNASEELEEGAVNRFRQIFPAVYPVGPLLPAICFSPPVEEKEKEECIEWLDKQKKGSVLYISFGTIAVLPPEQIRTLAEALEESGQAFLWVIRNVSSLPPSLHGILDRCCMATLNIPRGMIISWAPQPRVLNHASVGGFLSHCGWNSSMEAICAGVPLIAWPQIAEQHTNAKFIADEWKIGVRLELGEGEGLGKESSNAIVDTIRHLFGDDEEAGRLRLAMAHFSRLLRKSLIAPNGSSPANLISFIQSFQGK